MMPVIEELMEKYPGRIEKYNVADHRDIAMAMGIRATPTTILVNTNKISKAIIGARSSRVLEAMLATSND